MRAFADSPAMGARRCWGGAPIDVWNNPEARQALIEELHASTIIRGRAITAYGKDGKSIHGDLSGGIVELDGVEHLITIVHDLSDRERSAAILRLRLELREFAAGQSIGELVSKALESVENMTNSQAGFYHFVDEERGLVTRRAWSSRTLSEFCGIDPEGGDSAIAEAGSWADCLRERRAIVHNDYPSLPGRRGLPEGHGDILRELVTPIIREDRIVAVLGVCNKPTDYDEEDLALVSYIADLAWTIVAEKEAAERIMELNGRLERLAMTDELTGLSNRRAFFALAQRELQKARRYSAPLAFIMLDIDHFKSCNDSHGHDSGDAVLRMIAEVMRGQLRDVDIPARLGGEEFGVLLPNTTEREAGLSAERLRAAIASTSCENRGVTLSVTVSLGVAERREAAADLEAIMRKADEALYRAKAGGAEPRRVLGGRLTGREAVAALSLFSIART